MAEESTNNQVKSEKIEPEDVDEKADPNEILTITKVPSKILSRYLSTPKASCHDFCKYGIQHANEAKPWSPSKKRITTRERKTKVLEENVSSVAGTKKSGSSSKPPLTPKAEKPNCPVDIKEVVTNENTVTSEKNSPPSEETDVSMEHNNSDLKQACSEPSSLQVQECSKSQTKREIVKNKSPAGSSNRKETESRSKQKRTSLAEDKEKTTPPSIPLSSKHNVKKPSSLSAKTAKNLRRVSSLKTHENVEEVKPELASNDDLPDKILHVIGPTSANLSEEPNLVCDVSATKSPSPSPLPLSSADKSLKSTNKKTGKSGVSASSRKSLRHAGHGTRSTVSVTLSHQSAGNKSKTNVQHKTRIVSKSPSISSSASSSNSSRGKQSGTTSNSSFGKQSGTASKSSKTGHSNQGENVKMGYKIRPKVSTIVGAANKVTPPRKLTFRRGKVIEIQPQTNNIPRRLKFKPARLLGDDIRRDINGTRNRTNTNKEVDNGDELNAAAANIKYEKVVPKHQTVEGGKNRSIGRKLWGDRSKMYGSRSGSEKVVLRHQNVEGKKQNPRLYNNVIEETASMLAELRKSKVKALVGAFETVISLDSPREATPAEVSTAC